MPIDWRNERWAAWTAISVMVDWRWTGYNTLILLAAMQAIPRDLYECAAIDGAGPWRQLFRITIPMLRPTLIFVVIVSTIGGLQLFTEPLIFAGDSRAARSASSRPSRCTCTRRASRPLPPRGTARRSPECCS